MPDREPSVHEVVKLRDFGRAEQLEGEVVGRIKWRVPKDFYFFLFCPVY